MDDVSNYLVLVHSHVKAQQCGACFGASDAGRADQLPACIRSDEYYCTEILTNAAMTDTMDNPAAEPAEKELSGSEAHRVPVYCSDDDEAEDDEPTVVSTVPREVRWFRRLTNSRGEPSVLCRWVQTMPVLMVLVQLFVYTPKGDASFVGRDWKNFSEGAQSLITLASIGLCGALAAPGLLLVRSIQTALRPGGELDQLGAGRANVSTSSNRRLRYWRLFLTPVAGLCNLMGLSVLFVMAPMVTYRTVVLGEEMTKCVPQTDGTEVCFEDPLGPAYLVCFGSCILGLGNSVLLGFWPSMILASALCRDQISRLMVTLRTADPANSDRWQQNVVDQALAIDQSMRALSRGWGKALLGLSLASWCMSFNFFCKAINNEYVDAKEQMSIAVGDPGGARVNYVVFFAFFAMVPLLVSLEVAHTSSRCDVRMIPELIRIPTSVCCFMLGSSRRM